MASSSSVGTTSTGVGDLSAEMRRAALAGLALRCSSSSMPSAARPERVAPDGGVVLPDARGEGDDVGAAEHRQVGADVLAQPVDVDV